MKSARAECVIRNALGLHLRAAAAFVKVADRYQSDVELLKGEESANGKSILALATLNPAPPGTRLCIVATGPDADEAVSALVELVEDRFGEQS